MHFLRLFSLVFLSLWFTACEPEEVDPEPEPSQPQLAQRGDACDESIACSEGLECTDGVCADITTPDPETTDAGGSSDGAIDGTIWTDAGLVDLDAGGSSDVTLCSANEIYKPYVQPEDTYTMAPSHRIPRKFMYTMAPSHTIPCKFSIQ